MTQSMVPPTPDRASAGTSAPAVNRRPPLRIDLPSGGGLTLQQRDRHIDRSEADLEVAGRMLDRLREDPPIRPELVERMRAATVAGREPRLEQAQWDVLLEELMKDLREME